jgi:DNA adenine methylase
MSYAPLLKWAGGKSWLASSIVEACGQPRGRYFEPFVGGGAVLCAMTERFGPLEQPHLCDMNDRLITLYSTIRSEPDALIDALDELPWGADYRERYYELRAEFNVTDDLDVPRAVRTSALFLWLNRACFNGLYRENKSGQFNVPVGRYDQLRKPDPGAIVNWSADVLRTARLFAGDFALLLRNATDGDVVYCDPPYAPLTSTADFTEYNAGGFGWDDQLRLASECAQAAARGARVVASNHDTPKVRELYQDLGFELHTFKAPRRISRTVEGRADVDELLMILDRNDSALTSRSSTHMLTGTASRETIDVSPTPSQELSMSESPPLGTTTGTPGAAGVHVVFVEATVKGGVRANLGWKTLLVGPNGAGKSAIVNAIELALTGSASDLIGRDEVKDAALIGQLATPGAGVYSKVQLSNGVESTFEANRKPDGGYERGKNVNAFPAAFPLRAVREALAGDKNTVRKFLLAHACKALTVDDVVNRAPYDLQEAFAQGMGIYRNQRPAGSTTAVDELLALTDIARQEARKLTDAADTHEAIARERAVGLPADPLAADLAQARIAMDAALTALTNAPMPVTIPGKLDVERCERIALHYAAEFKRLRAEHEAAVKALPPAEVLQRTNLQRSRLEALKIVASWSRDKGVCRVCYAPSGQLVSDADIDGALASINTAVHLLANEQTLAHQLKTTKSTAERAIEDWQQAVEWNKTVDVKIAEAQETNARASAKREELRAEYERLRNVYDQHNTAHMRYTEVRHARDTAAGMRVRAELYKRVESAAKVLVGQLLDSSVEAFEASVQRFLPARDRFGLVLRDGEREVCRFGFWRGDDSPHLHTALSGAEWARLCVALACAVANPDPQRPTVIVPEERAFDPETLREVMAALVNAPAQVIITSPVGPTSPVDGWKVVNVGDGAPAVVAAPKKPRRSTKKTAPSAMPAPAVNGPVQLFAHLAEDGAE